MRRIPRTSGNGHRAERQVSITGMQGVQLAPERKAKVNGSKGI